jgi:hypothetical protein
MPTKERGPFRTLGMRMQAFGRSLIRHFLPTQRPQLKSLPPPSPGWQAHTETPLIWNEPEAVSAPVEQVPEEAPPIEMPPVEAPPPRRTRPAAPPVQRKANKEEKIDPRLLAILSAHQAHDDYAAKVREERHAAAAASEAQRKADETNPDTPPQPRRRSRASFDYVETKALLPPEEEMGRTAPPKRPAQNIQTTRQPDQPQDDDDTEESRAAESILSDVNPPESVSPATVQQAVEREFSESSSVAEESLSAPDDDVEYAAPGEPEAELPDWTPTESASTGETRAPEGDQPKSSKGKSTRPIRKLTPSERVQPIIRRSPDETPEEPLAESGADDFAPWDEMAEGENEAGWPPAEAASPAVQRQVEAETYADEYEAGDEPEPLSPSLPYFDAEDDAANTRPVQALNTGDAPAAPPSFPVQYFDAEDEVSNTRPVQALNTGDAPAAPPSFPVQYFDAEDEVSNTRPVQPVNTGDAPVEPPAVQREAAETYAEVNEAGEEAEPPSFPVQYFDAEDDAANTRPVQPVNTGDVPTAPPMVQREAAETYAEVNEAGGEPEPLSQSLPYFDNEDDSSETRPLQALNTGDVPAQRAWQPASQDVEAAPTAPQIPGDFSGTISDSLAEPPMVQRQTEPSDDADVIWLIPPEDAAEQGERESNEISGESGFEADSPERAFPPPVSETNQPRRPSPAVQRQSETPAGTPLDGGDYWDDFGSESHQMPVISNEPAPWSGQPAIQRMPEAGYEESDEPLSEDYGADSEAAGEPPLVQRHMAEAPTWEDVGQGDFERAAPDFPHEIDSEGMTFEEDAADFSAEAPPAANVPNGPVERKPQAASRPERSSLPQRVQPESFSDEVAEDTEQSFDDFAASAPVEYSPPPGQIRRKPAEPESGLESASPYEPADDEAEPPLDVYEAMVRAGLVPSAPPTPGRAEIARKPERPSVTPPPPPAPVPHPSSADSRPNRLPIHYAGDQQSVMRAETESEQSNSSGGGAADVNVDKLADDVYRVLREKLRIEKERRGRG